MRTIGKIVNLGNSLIAARHSLFRGSLWQEVQQAVQHGLLHPLVVLLCGQVETEDKVEIVVADVAAVAGQNAARPRPVQPDLTYTDSVLRPLSPSKQTKQNQPRQRLPTKKTSLGCVVQLPARACCGPAPPGHTASPPRWGSCLGRVWEQLRSSVRSAA